MPISDEQLLAEFEDLIRTMPPKNTLHHLGLEIDEWIGRAQALVSLWSPREGPGFNLRTGQIHQSHSLIHEDGVRGVLHTIYQARTELRLKTVGHLATLVSKGNVYDYFDEIRKVIEGASSIILFVDPYLDAEFVSVYLPHVRAGVKVQLLTNKSIDRLKPAVEKFHQQTCLTVEIRQTTDLHDRYIFIDRQTCFQSGASFKDGAKKSPTMLNQIVDPFPAVLSLYEELWEAGTSIYLAPKF